MDGAIEKPQVLRCTFCETLFESDVADPGADGAPRCPQCGLTSAETAAVSEDDFVVCAGTKFR
jgi:DNA-directed RNA polymerase subunit RPC12/RpoP